jgi:hypothetical protein
MLAMNMSKEVLSAFGLMNEKFESSNETSKLSNEQMLMALDAKAAEAKGEFALADVTALTKKLLQNSFMIISEPKAEVLKGFEVDPETGKLPYEEMDKGDNIDDWF